ncbi:MAG: Hpt domain-containing protein, partial [Gammaproteobacteria bacterium]|nr:Hpt domain-containing protein [Gammaproteobacteria bacterium]
LFEALAKHLQPGSGTPAALSDEDPMLEARQIFIEGLAEKIENLVNQLMAQDWEAMKGVIHTLKGNGGTFGYPELTRQARAIEDHLKASDFDPIEAMMAELAELIAEIQTGELAPSDSP